MADKLQPGDRVAYSAYFLRQISAHTGCMPFRQGHYLGPDPVAPATHSRVFWDDIPKLIAAKRGYYGSEDFAEECTKNGEMVATSAIARVGSAKYSSNDIK